MYKAVALASSDVEQSDTWGFYSDLAVGTALVVLWTEMWSRVTFGAAADTNTYWAAPRVMTNVLTLPLGGTDLAGRHHTATMLVGTGQSSNLSSSSPLPRVSSIQVPDPPVCFLDTAWRYLGRPALGVWVASWPGGRPRRLWERARR